MREQMAVHRANPVCAACHAQMDQLGFALENFDAIGEWRDIYASGLPIDASAEFPDGTTFDGPRRAPRPAAEPRRRLPDHRDRPPADLRPRPRPRGDRHAHRTPDQARRGCRRPPLRRPRAGRRRERPVPDADGAGPGGLRNRAQQSGADEAQAAHRHSDLPRDSRGELLLRRQDRLCATTGRARQALLPVAPPPLRQEPLPRHAEGAVRGSRAAVSRVGDPRPLGLVEAPSGTAAELRRRQVHGNGPSAREPDGAVGRRRTTCGDRCGPRDRAGALRSSARDAARAHGPARRGARRRIRQAYSRCVEHPRGRALQPQLSARSVLNDQGPRRPHPLYVPHRRQQVLQGEPVLRPEPPAGHHPGPTLLGSVRLHRPGPGHGVRGRAPRPRSCGDPRLVQRIQLARRGASLQPLRTSCCSSTVASSAPGGSRRARRRS